MTAAVKTAAAPTTKSPTMVVAVTSKEVPLASIRPSPLNPRKTFGDLTELKASIATKGLLVPLLVRPWARGVEGGLYELADGERRLRALTELGVETVRVEVRDLTDQELVEIALVSVLTREDLPVMEEARALASLRDKVKLPLEEIAARTGKGAKYISQRVRLATDLCDEAQKALDEGRLLVGVAQLLVLVAKDKQKDMLGDLAAGEPMWEGAGADNITTEPASIAEARRTIFQELRRLKDAPFDRKDAALVVVAGSCVTCPKRTDAQGDMFGGDSKDARCLDGPCWDSKVTAHSKKLVEDARSKGLTIIEGKKAKALFDKEMPDQLEYDGPVKELDERVYLAGGKSTTLRDAIKKSGIDVPVSIVVDPTGKAHEVLDAKLAKKVTDEAEKLARKAAGKPEPKDDGPTLAEVQAEAELAAALDALVAKAAKAPVAKILRLACMDLDNSGMGDREVISQRHSVKGSSIAVQDLIEKAKPADLQALFVEILCSDSYDSQKREDVADALGVDIDAVIKKARADAEKKFKAEKAAPSTPAAKKGGKK